MSLDYTKLVSQGRAKAPNVCWSEVELEALLALEREFKIPRIAAADYIRNGIITIEDYKKAQDAKFIPKTLDQADTDKLSELKARGEAVVKKARKTKKETK